MPEYIHRHKIQAIPRPSFGHIGEERLIYEAGYSGSRRVNSIRRSWHISSCSYVYYGTDWFTSESSGKDFWGVSKVQSCMFSLNKNQDSFEQKY